MIRERSTKEITEAIKDILSPYHGDVKIFDKEVAAALRMSPVNLAVAKKRGAWIHKPVLDFCLRTGSDPMKIFYERVEDQE